MSKIILLPLIISTFIIKINSLDLDLEKIRSEILSDHNYHRKRHQVDTLVRNSEIEKVAQTYSEHLAEIGNMQHSQNEKYGENLYYCMSSAGICVTGQKASQSWYNEVKQYNFADPKFTSGTGHFTQLVWKASKQIGCGAACKNNKCFVTCNYYPRGNYLGQFGNNVFPLKEDSGSSGGSGSTEGSGNSGSGTSSGNSVNNSSGGMSTAGKAILGIFVILIILIIAFSIFHFVYRKKRFSDIKYYFVKKTY